jgi:cbb3-type cytochrome oxidase maturation protein
MSIIYILIPIAVLLTSLGIYLFFWAVKTEQFDDLEKQGMSIFFDDDKPKDSAVTEPNMSTKQTKPARNMNINMADKSASSNEEHLKH